MLDSLAKEVGNSAYGKIAQAVAARRSIPDDVDVRRVFDVDPPVCTYIRRGCVWPGGEASRRASLRNQTNVSSKEIRVRPRIGDHDYRWKRDRAAQFLQDRSKVRVVVSFRGREREHVDAGRRLLEQVAADVQECGHVEAGITSEGPKPHDVARFDVAALLHVGCEPLEQIVARRRHARAPPAEGHDDPDLGAIL